MTNLELSVPEKRWVTTSFLFLHVSLELIYSSFPVKLLRASGTGLGVMDFPECTQAAQRGFQYGEQEVKLRDLKFPVNPHSQVAIFAF